MAAEAGAMSEMMDWEDARAGALEAAAAAGGRWRRMIDEDQ